jgi:hypothetical protein
MAYVMALDGESRPYVIVRASGAGVHSGWMLADRGAERIVLGGSRRLWRWHGRTLSGLALEGPDDLNQCKFGDVLPEITILGACEIIPCTEISRERIAAVSTWVND